MSFQWPSEKELPENWSKTGQIPKIVVLCGSTRFYEYFQRANYRETMEGNIVLTVGFYKELGEHGQSYGCTPDQKLRLDELHKRKIDLADEVLVLNVDGYIGRSTYSEILYATENNKHVRYLETPRECILAHDSNEICRKCSLTL